MSANKLTCLLFRVAYKVKYEPPGGAPAVTREFVLGNNPFFLNFSDVAAGCILDSDLDFALTPHRETAAVNDLVWDANEAGTDQAVDAVINISMTLSNGEDPAAEQDA